MRSYTSQHTSLKMLVREARSLYRSHAEYIPENVRRVLAELRDLESRLKNNYSFCLRHRDILDIGAGQLHPQMYYFAVHNRVIGIDLDVIAQGLNPTGYVTMLWVNGPRRTAKTIIRKLSGIDRRYRDELKVQLHVRSLPKLNVRQMDACNMTLKASSFDLVHCFSVLQSLPNPRAAINGIARVLRPGGVAYMSVHLYTSKSGALDLRASAQPTEVVPWSHLRPDYARETYSTTYLNKLRLQQWRELFAECLPGAELLLTRTADPRVKQEASDLLEQGELSGYALEELVTHRIRILWQKT